MRKGRGVKWVWLVVGWLCGWGYAGAQSLTAQLETLLEQATFLQTSEVGIAVYDLTDGQPLFRYQADKLYRPASVAKVITSVTALARLGEAYTFRTQLAYTGAIVNDTLQGDLYVIGHLDPEFSEDDLTGLAEAVEQAGIRHVAGSLVGDVTMTDSIYWGNGWSWDDAPEYFQPYLSPLMLNRGVVDIAVKPSVKGTPPEVTVAPASDYYTVCNRSLSHTPAAGKLRVTRDWMHLGNELLIDGNAVRPYACSLSLFASERFFLHTLRYQLRQRGIRVDSVATGACPPEALLLAKVVRPLREVLLRALKKSDNLSAEALFFHLGLQRKGALPVTFKDGREALEQFMRQELQCDPKNYVLVDGSGLSPYDLVSPDLLVEYLKYAAADSALSSALYTALPVAGIDGTLQHRMKSGRAFRNVHAKTGSVTGVSSLVGYVDRKSTGHRLAFAIINQNVRNVAEARAFQNQLCELLAH